MRVIEKLFHLASFILVRTFEIALLSRPHQRHTNKATFIASRLCARRDTSKQANQYIDYFLICASRARDEYKKSIARSNFNLGIVSPGHEKCVSHSVAADNK